MNDKLQRFQRRLEKLLGDEEESIIENQFDAMISRTFLWLICNLLPTLFLALVINVALMFVTPVEIVMSEWFWLKDPISILAGYAIFRISRSLFLRYKSDL